MPPADEVLDLNKVRVDFTANGAASTQFPRAMEVASCGANSAWHYDDNNAPTQVVLCPAACAAVEGGGGLKITLGCMPDQVVIQ
jgi:hypothetical protein